MARSRFVDTFVHIVWWCSLQPVGGYDCHTNTTLAAENYVRVVCVCMLRNKLLSVKIREHGLHIHVTLHVIADNANAFGVKHSWRPLSPLSTANAATR